MPPPTGHSIALIICSTRPGRINPTMAGYISSLMQPSLPAGVTLHTIDLKLWDLPMFNESTIPAGLPAASPTEHYATSHARAWSAEIARHDAFVFVTPQYNWSMPASVKNAIDYLFHEWTGKVGVVVSYGGHGGGKSRAALENVLEGIKMRVVPGVEITVKVQEGFELGEKEGEGVKEVGGGLGGKWKEMGVEESIGRMSGEVVRLLEE